MSADPQLVEASNKIVVIFINTAGPILLMGGVIIFAIAIIRRNTGEAVNRFFWRRSKTEKKCPVDGGILMKRRGKYGPFLGCSNYPQCKYIEGGKRE